MSDVITKVSTDWSERTTKWCPRQLCDVTRRIQVLVPPWGRPACRSVVVESRRFGMPGTTATFPCRVKYLNDMDPFAYYSQYPEPPRPPIYQFHVERPLGEQLPAIHRILAAPHKVSLGAGPCGWSTRGCWPRVDGTFLSHIMIILYPGRHDDTQPPALWLRWPRMTRWTLLCIFVLCTVEWCVREIISAGGGETPGGTGGTMFCCRWNIWRTRALVGKVFFIVGESCKGSPDAFVCWGEWWECKEASVVTRRPYKWRWNTLVKEKLATGETWQEILTWSYISYSAIYLLLEECQSLIWLVEPVYNIE